MHCIAVHPPYAGVDDAASGATAPASSASSAWRRSGAAAASARADDASVADSLTARCWTRCDLFPFDSERMMLYEHNGSRQGAWIARQSGGDRIVWPKCASTTLHRPTRSYHAAATPHEHLHIFTCKQCARAWRQRAQQRNRWPRPRSEQRCCSSSFLLPVLLSCCSGVLSGRRTGGGNGLQQCLLLSAGPV